LNSSSVGQRGARWLPERHQAASMCRSRMPTRALFLPLGGRAVAGGQSVSNLARDSFPRKLCPRLFSAHGRVGLHGETKWKQRRTTAFLFFCGAGPTQASESVSPPSWRQQQQKDLRQREGTFTTCSTVAISITYRDKSVARIFATSALGRFLNWIAWNAGHDFASSGGPSRVPTYQLREQLGP
jgi:hypothetical protein